MPKIPKDAVFTGKERSQCGAARSLFCFVAAVALLCFEIRFGDVFFLFRCGSKQSSAPSSSSSSSPLLPFPLANNAFSVVIHERSALEDAPVCLGFLCSLVVSFVY